MSQLSDARRDAWFRRRLEGAATEREAYNAGFDAGAKWCLLHTSSLSPYVNQFIELLVLLGFTNAEQGSYSAEESSNGGASVDAQASDRPDASGKRTAKKT